MKSSLKVLKKVAINPKHMIDQKFALSGEAGKSRYHVWVDAQFNLDDDAVIYWHFDEHKRSGKIGLKTKLGGQILESLIENAKHFSLMELALEQRKLIDAKQKIANASRAEKRADKERAYNTLIFIAKTMRNPRFSTHDDPCLIELKAKAEAVLGKLAL